MPPTMVRPEMLHKILCVTVFFITTLVYICATPLNSQAKPLRIGATISLEGKYAELSSMVRSGYELWVKQINSDGGILGRKVELVLYDDKSDADRAAALYQKLITEDKVDLLLSPYGSTLTMEAARVSDKHGYVLLAASASSTAIWQQGFDSVFGVYSTADRYFIGFLDLLARRGLEKIAIVHGDATFHVSAAYGAEKWARLFGLDVVFRSQFSKSSQKFPEILDQLDKYKPDGLVFSSYPPNGYRFLRLLEKASFKPPATAMAITPALPGFYSRVGSIAEGIFAPSQWEADERIPFPGTKDFIYSFTQLTGKSPSYQACASYSACMILEHAIRQTGEISHSRIRDYIAALDTITIMGRFKVDDTGRQVGHNSFVIQWQNGKKEIVYPKKMSTATAKIVARDYE